MEESLEGSKSSLLSKTGFILYLISEIVHLCLNSGEAGVRMSSTVKMGNDAQKVNFRATESWYSHQDTTKQAERSAQLIYTTNTEQDVTQERSKRNILKLQGTISTSKQEKFSVWIKSPTSKHHNSRKWCTKVSNPLTCLNTVSSTMHDNHVIQSQH